MRSMRILAACGLLSAVGLAARPLPAEAGRAGEDLFPTKNGSSWTYDGTVGTQKLNMQADITSSISSGGKTVVVIHWTQNGQAMQDETFVVSPQEVLKIKAGLNGGISTEPPVPIIKYPLTVGKTWTWSGNQVAGTMKIPAKASLKVVARETVKTGAGTYSAYRVDMDLTSSSQGQTVKVANSYWFAPGAGLIKQKAIVTRPDGQKLTIEAAVSKVKTK